ncbi:hypothetical protein AB0I46_35445, partial [Streptomyces spectabilis]
MSRETDSSSSGPHGRAGAAYPSGTPPYGSPAQGVGPDGGTDGAGLGPGDRRTDEPKTETTLTTRIRINIPGSRPIPPVVMRTPVGDADGDRGTEPRGLDDTAAGPGPLGGASSALSGPAPSAPAPGGTVNGGAAPQASAGSAGSAGGSASGDDGGEPTSDWFAPRKASPKGPSTPSAPAPSSGTGSGDSGTGAYDVSGAVANGPLGSGGEPRRDDLPYFPDGDRPAGPTGGPVTGDGPMITPEPPAEAGPYGTGAADPYGMGTDPFAGGPAGPGGPGRLSDDTAILTPQKPVPGAGGPPPPPPQRPAPGPQPAPRAPELTSSPVLTRRPEHSL